jgi:hypothetical protein
MATQVSWKVLLDGIAHGLLVVVQNLVCDTWPSTNTTSFHRENHQLRSIQAVLFVSKDSGCEAKSSIGLMVSLLLCSTSGT